MILYVAGARPNFMKVAPVMRAVAALAPERSQFFVHTGQHYDALLSEVFLDELELPRPDANLDVGSATQARQTAEIMLRLEPFVLERRPELAVVVGDVNSTLAASLVCAKVGVTLVHVEAGLRSFDRSMPEELNRIVTDQLSDIHLTSEAAAGPNLLREGIDPKGIHFVGNVMIDTLMHLRARAEQRPILATLGERPVILVTLHRPTNVDRPESLVPIADALAACAREARVIFPIHPRTRANIERLGLLDRFAACELRDPLGYLDFLALQMRAAAVVTDSGGVQEETTFLGVPCVTVRDNTERPITITHGTNVLVGRDPERIVVAVRDALAGRTRRPAGPPPLWDGHAAERAARILLETVGG